MPLFRGICYVIIVDYAIHSITLYCKEKCCNIKFVGVEFGDTTCRTEVILLMIKQYAGPIYDHLYTCIYT